MKYVFGPVPSRRLGQSLGIDPVPLKTCNWNCIYCQLGRSRPVVNERKEYFPSEEIVDEAVRALAAHPRGDIDWVTFLGSGEPLLHTGIGAMIRRVKATTDLPVAVITNGSLLYLTEVQQDLARADAVLASLDAGTPELYRRINRPHAEVTFERLIAGLIAFRQSYDGNLWPEVMLVRGRNDSEPALRDIAACLERIRPDEIHVNLPTRPPAEGSVEPPDEEGVMRATAILGDVAPVRVADAVEGTIGLSGCETAVDAVIAVITRHPMRQEELEHALTRWAPGQVQEALVELEASRRAREVIRYGKRFWTAAGCYFAESKLGREGLEVRRRR